MRIAEAASWRVDFQLAQPYTIAYETFDHATNVFLRLVSVDGTVGSGCAAPAPEVTGETAQATEAALEAVEAAISGIDIEPGFRIDPLVPHLAGCPAAAAAVDMALHDLIAKRKGVPLYRALGAIRSEVITSVTIGIDTLAETRARAREYVRQGFRALKVKGGSDVGADIERIRALRVDLGTSVALRFDANQGYDLDATLRFVSSTADCGVEILEQPLSAGDPEADRALRSELDRLDSKPGRGHRPPLMADESILGPHDAEQLVRRGDFEAFNVKLMKAGGIGPARSIAATARRHGLPTMLSCMDEAALGIAAGLHVALSTAGITWVDLDGHFDLVEDPTAGAVLLHDGCLSVTEMPGLGVDLTA